MLTTEQLKLRKSHLGASDVAALFGLDPFKTGADVWLDKTFDIEPPARQNDSIDMGNAFETPLLGWAARELGVNISTVPGDLFAVCKAYPVFSATLDSIILDAECVVLTDEAIEAKVTSRSEEYGEPGTDQVPDRVNVQVQAQMLCHDLKRVHVAVLMGRNGLRRELYLVERDEDIITSIIQRGEWFWNEFVLPKKQPPELDENGKPLFGLGSLEYIRRVVRQPQTWAEVDEALILDWDSKRQARLEAETVEKEALERMLTPLGDAEGARLSNGRILTYYPTVKNILDQSRLKAEQPEIYASFLKESVSRTPRIKKGV